MRAAVRPFRVWWVHGIEAVAAELPQRVLPAVLVCVCSSAEVMEDLYDEIDDLEDELAFVDEEDMLDNEAATMETLEKQAGADSNVKQQ